MTGTAQIHGRRGRIGGRGGSVPAPLKERDARHPAAGDGRYCGLGDPRKDVIEAVGVVKLLGNVGEHHREARGWSVGLPPLRRFIPIGSCLRPFRQRLVSVLSRLRPASPGLGPLCRRSRILGGNAKLPDARVQLRFPLVELRLPVVGGPVPGVGHLSRSSATSSRRSATKSRLSAAHARSSSPDPADTRAPFSARQAVPLILPSLAAADPP